MSLSHVLVDNSVAWRDARCYPTALSSITVKPFIRWHQVRSSRKIGGTDHIGASSNGGAILRGQVGAKLKKVLAGGAADRKKHTMYSKNLH